jgi:protein-tyrosine-phosphatase
VKWVTRERPKVDRIACPWLIRRFVDPDAEFLYVPADRVLAVAEREGATPFDVPGVELGHHGDACSFDAIISRYGLTDLALGQLAVIVRGADTDARDLAPESRGLEAIAEGFRLAFQDDQEQLAHELPVYDALYAYCRQRVGNGAGASPPPTVLFLCPHNALRSVIAAALFNQQAGVLAHAESAGTEPDERVNERTVIVLREVGIEMADAPPARVTHAQLERAHRVVSLDCPLPPELAAVAAGKLERWPMPDTTGKPVDAVREVRELIRARVEGLLTELAVDGGGGGGGNERR